MKHLAKLLCIFLSAASAFADLPTTTKPPLTPDGAQTVTNKIINAAQNSISNVDPITTSANLIEYWDAYDITGVADGGNVATWTGRKGNAATRTIAHALYSGYDYPQYSARGLGGAPALWCQNNGTLVTSNILSGSYPKFTLAFLVNYLSCPSTSGEYTIAAGNNLGSNWLGAQVGLGVSSQGCFSMFLPGGVALVGRDRFVLKTHVFFYTFDGTDNTLGTGLARLYTDGISSDAENATTASLTLSGGFTLGNASPGDSFNYYIGAVAAWNDCLTEQQVRERSQYLLRRFNADTRRRCFLWGDSLMSGAPGAPVNAAPASGSMADQLQAAIPAVQFINIAKGGQSVQTQAAGTPPWDQMAAFGPGDVVLIGPADIDIMSNGRTALQAEADLTTVVDRINATGAYTIILTVPSKQADTTGHQSAYDSERATYNTWASTPSNAHAKGVADIAGVSGLGGNTDWQSLTYRLYATNTPTGLSGAGAITLSTFIPAGKRVAYVHKTSDDSDISSDYEGYISVGGQIQQTGGSHAYGITVVTNDGAHWSAAGNAAQVPTIKSALQPAFGITFP